MLLFEPTDDDANAPELLQEIKVCLYQGANQALSEDVLEKNKTKAILLYNTNPLSEKFHEAINTDNLLLINAHFLLSLNPKDATNLIKAIYEGQQTKYNATESKLLSFLDRHEYDENEEIQASIKSLPKIQTCTDLNFKTELDPILPSGVLKQYLYLKHLKNKFVPNFYHALAEIRKETEENSNIEQFLTSIGQNLAKKAYQLTYENQINLFSLFSSDYATLLGITHISSDDNYSIAKGVCQNSFCDSKMRDAMIRGITNFVSYQTPSVKSNNEPQSFLEDDYDSSDDDDNDDN
jgi:hypothetical protein